MLLMSLRKEPGSGEMQHMGAVRIHHSLHSKAPALPPAVSILGGRLPEVGAHFGGNLTRKVYSRHHALKKNPCIVPKICYSASRHIFPGH